MNILRIAFLAIGLFVFNGQSWIEVGQAVQPRATKVPKAFSYPEARETIKANAPTSVSSLNGRVVDSTDAPMERVLVERLGRTWGRRLDATFTDSKGSFSFFGREKVAYLKFSKPGFDTLLLRVRINKRAKGKLRAALNPST